MSDTKWTPGPWTVDDLTDLVYVIEDNADTGPWRCICNIWPSRLLSSGDATYNARLIAAAPELYEALEECVKQIRGIASPMDVPESAISALKKARGES